MCSCGLQSGSELRTMVIEMPVGHPCPYARVLRDIPPLHSHLGSVHSYARASFSGVRQRKEKQSLVGSGASPGDAL